MPYLLQVSMTCVVADGAARLHNVRSRRCGARARCCRRTGRRRHEPRRHAGHGIQPGALFLGGQRVRLLGEGLCPDAVAEHILRRRRRCKRRWRCRGSARRMSARNGRSSTFGMLAQLPVVGLVACQTGAVDAALLARADADGLAVLARSRRELDWVYFSAIRAMMQVAALRPRGRSLIFGHDVAAASSRCRCSGR